MAVSAPVLGLIVYPEASSVPGLCRLPPLSCFKKLPSGEHRNIGLTVEIGFPTRGARFSCK